jgi:hypothetical protein
LSMGLNRQAIEERVQAFLSEEDLYLDQITLHHGAALVFHGMKQTTCDIDLEVPSDVFVRLREKYAEGRIPLKFHDDLPFTHPSQFKPYLQHGLFDDYVVYSIEAILKAKLQLNRSKDQDMIQRLQQHLERTEECSL